MYGVLVGLLFGQLCLARQVPEPGNAARLPSPYVDYLEGSGLNVILSAPHGGDEKPSAIPDRTSGCWIAGACVWTHDCGTPDSTRCKATTVKDMNTQELCRELYDALCTEFGQCPAAVINLLHRSKFDANRDEPEATFGVPEVELAWQDYHAYIDSYKGGHGSGLFIDLHGHGHSIVRNELGYLISGSNLDSGSFTRADSSIKHMAEMNAPTPFEQILRGVSSFGDFLEREGFASVPSPNDLSPGGASYFSGGYNTARHGSRDGGVIDAIQIEAPRAYRDLPTRTAFVQALVVTIRDYLLAHY